MKYPNVPVYESRFRHVGRLSAFRLTVILAAVVLTAPFAVADSNPLNNNHTRADTPGTSSTDSPEVAAAKRKVADLQIKLLMFQDHLADLQTQEPKDPGPNASAGDRKKYKTAHSAWQQNVDKIQHQIDYVKQQLAIAQKELQAAEAAARGGH